MGGATLVAKVWDWRKDAGPVLDPDTAWHVLRGAQTLRLRVDAANANALAVAQVLEREGLAVRHPLLESHPDHAVALDQMPKGCCVLTLDLGSESAAMAFLDRLQLVFRAVSLGGYESLASHPWSTTHKAMAEPVRKAAGITPGLVRISLGVEPLEDLLHDILGALQRRPVTRAAAKAKPRATMGKTA